MPFFSIGHSDRERLEVNLLGLDKPKNAHDDWIRASVRADVGAFQANLEIWICFGDIVQFKEQLEPVYRDLKGVAEFKTLEGQLYIRIELDHLGHVLASGYLLDEFVNFVPGYD